MQLLSITLGKTIFSLLRLLGRTGSALPGLIVEKLNRGFLPHMLRQLPHGVIIISGTNGKTTTTKITVALLESQGLRVLTNRTGSNFVRGIISAVIDKSKWNSDLPYDIAVFEQDEAHAVRLAKIIKPKGVVVLNIMRDQMDRFGEIDTTRKMLQELTAAATDWVVLNANDERVGKLEPSAKTTVHWYGHAKELQRDFLTDDQLYHAEPTSFYLAHEPEVLLRSYGTTQVSLKIGQDTHTYDYALQGGHNALNLAAALTVLRAALPDYTERAVVQVLAELQPAFGRGEVITLPSGGLLTLQLVKNPGGFTQALRMLKLKRYKLVGIAINDNYPDGRDVSWLWDVDFTALGNAKHILCGGSRAADMANRLKYDEAQVTATESNLEYYAKQLDVNLAEGDDGILFCTYTAMLRLRGIYLGTYSGLDEVEL